VDALLRRIGSESGLILIVAIAMLAIALPIVLWRIRSGEGALPAAWKTGLEGAILGSVAVIVALTLGAFATGGQGQINWLPFQSLFDSLALGEFWTGMVMTDLLGNFLLFIPIGLVVGLRFAQARIWVWAAVVVAFTSAIEIAQFLVLNRSADTTDVVMNGLGGIAGFVIARTLQRLLSPAKEWEL